jgi:hypothetical protein
MSRVEHASLAWIHEHVRRGQTIGLPLAEIARFPKKRPLGPRRQQYHLTLEEQIGVYPTFSQTLSGVIRETTIREDRWPL